MNNKKETDLAVGLDVAADSATMAIVHRTDGEIGKIYKIDFGKLESLNGAAEKIKEAQEKYSAKVCCFLESTGIYHIPLVRFLKERGHEVVVLNPIITKNNINGNVRDVHSDRTDAKKIALIGLSGVAAPSLIPDDTVMGMRRLSREYFGLTDKQTTAALSLEAVLKVSFPKFSGIFSKLTTRTALAVLDEWPGPQAIVSAEKEAIVKLIQETSRRGPAYAEKKAEDLIEAAECAFEFGVQTPGDAAVVRSKVHLIQAYTTEKDALLKGMKEMAAKEQEAESVLARRLDLLQTIHGIGFLSAFALLAEIGDFDKFSNAKALTAFFGIDPRVRQSGKFTADRTHMSKRGNPRIRRILHQIAISNIRVSKETDTPMNPAVYAYYAAKCEGGKSKLAALGAVEHKFTRIIFAVLRDMQPYVMLTTEEHNKQYRRKLAAAAH